MVEKNAMKKKKPEIKDILRTIDIEHKKKIYRVKDISGIITAEHKKKIYGVKDIVRICGLDRNQVFYWSKTLKEIEPEYITPGRRLFNFRSLLDFRLVFEMQHLGLSPKIIKRIVFLFERVDTPTRPLIRRFSIWDIFLKDRSTYEQKGFYLFSSESAYEYPEQRGASHVKYSFGTAAHAERSLLREMANDPLKMKNSFMVNLLRIIQQVEGETGERLE